MALQPDMVNAAAPHLPQGESDSTRSWLGRYLLWLGLVLVISMTTAACVIVWRLRGDELDVARVGLNSKGVAITEQTARAVQAVDLVLQEVYIKAGEAALTGKLRDSSFLTSQSFQQFLSASMRNMPQMDVVSLVDPDGRLIAFSRSWPTPEIDLSDRDYFKYLRDTDDPRPYISTPVQNRGNGTWVFYLARRIDGPEHAFRGVALAAMPVKYFEDFYQAVSHSADETVVLARRDGILLARMPAQPSMIGQHQPPSADRSRLLASGGGQYISPAHGQLGTRIVSVHPLPMYPLFVDVGITESAALASWRRTACLIAIGGAASLLGFAVLFHSLRRQFQSLERQRTELVMTARALGRSQRDSQENAQQLETTLAAMGEGLMMVDADEQVVVCNARAIELLQLPRDLVAGRPRFMDIVRYQWEHNEFERSASAQLAFMRGGRLLDAPPVYERERPNGTVLEVRTVALPGGGAIRTYIDITARRLAEKMGAERDEADRASQAKSQFLAVMSHEIRSPMSGLIGVIEMLRATRLDEEQARMAVMAQEAGEMLLAVLNDILDFSKIEAGALAINPEAVNPRDLLHHLVEPYRVHAGRKGLSFTLAIAEDVPEYMLTDPLRLRQIVGNLLSNAIKFTARGGVGVRVSRDRVTRELCFAVHDTGIGLSPEAMARLFQPFMQAERTTTRNYGGTGLGLSISHQLARLMGGVCMVDSVTGVGSTFSLRLPLVEASAPAAMPVLADLQATEDAALGGGRRVLVVDDDPTNRWLAQRQASTLGFTVDTAENGMAGLARLRDGRYDLLITDCHMPELDGIGLTEAVRTAQDAVLRAIPIIGLTADSTDDQRLRCREVGMTELAIKPLTVPRMAHLVTRVLGLAVRVGPPAAEPARLRAVAFDDQIFLGIFPPGNAEGAAWLEEYLATARDDAQALAEMLERPMEPALLAAVGTLAHRMAGAAFSVGAMLLGDAARAVERAALGGDTDALADLQATLRAAHATAAAEISAFLASGAANAA